MRKNILICVAALIVLSLSFLFFKRAQRELLSHTSMIDRTDNVYRGFHDLSREINKAAIINPDLLMLSGSDTGAFFFTDSLAIMRHTDYLKAQVQDSVNIKIAGELDVLTRAELPWLLKSNVPDSMIHHPSSPHIRALQHIDSLIQAGIVRTQFLRGYGLNQLNKASVNMSILMMVFIGVAGILLLYTTLQLFRQQSQRKQKEEELAISNEGLRGTTKEISDYKYALDESSIVAVTDQKGIIRHVNDNFCRISKYSREELIGQDHRIINSGYHPKEFIRDLWRTIANGKIWKGELKNRAKDGTTYWVDTTIVPFLDPQGKPYQYIAIRADITSRKIIEENLEKTVKEISDYKYALDESSIVAVTDQKGIIKHVNDNFCRISKYSREELIGEDHRLINSGHHPKEFIRDLWRTIANGKIWKGELKNRAKDGTTYWVDTTIVPFLDHQGKPYQYIAIRSDITQRKQIGEMLLKNETALREAQSIAHICNWEIDLQTNTHTWSDEFYNIFGIEKEEVVPLAGTFLSFIHPDDASEVSRVINKAFETFLPASFNARIHTPGGSMRYIYSEWKFELDKSGKPLRLFGILQDVTEKRITEEAVLNTLEEKNTILESIGDAFIAVDKNWTVTYWNRVAETALGTLKQDIIGKNLWEVFPASVRSESYRRYHEAIAANEVVHFENYYEPMDKWYEVSAYPSRAGLSVYFKDITERKLSDIRLGELNEDLQKRAKELMLSNQELEQFAYVASHDLQEPLRMVTGFLTQLEKKYGDIIDDKGKKYIGFAVDGAKRMRQIILDLLEFSRVGRMEENLEPVDLEDLVNEIRILFRKTIEEKEAQIETAGLPVIHTYRTPMRQVFQNLISNALKYSRTEIAPVIRITAEESAGHWQFAVADNGIGIGKEYFDRIFVIFQRLHNKDEFSGTGMGLAISNKIIDNLGGKIWLESEEGKGSTFYFSIPKL